MKGNYKAIVFDIDGTLIDTEKAVLISLQHTFYRMFHILKKEEDLYFVLGIPGKMALRNMGITEDQIPEALEQWDRYYGWYSYSSSVFEGIEKVIQDLKLAGKKTGIVTSKTREEYVTDCYTFPILKIFKNVICSDDVRNPKPAADSLLKCMKDMEVMPEETLYIGDAIYDYQCACAADVDFALAGWGCKMPDQIDAKYKMEVPEKILEIV